MSDNLKNRSIHLHVPHFPKYVEDYEMRDEPEVHALMDYALNCGLMQEEADGIYEGDKNRPVNYRQLMRTTASIHNIPPEVMIKQWPEVDRVLALMGLKPITEARARMGGQIILN